MTVHPTKTARDLVAEMRALEAKLALTVCRGCSRPLNTYVQPGLRPTSATTVYGTCMNPACERFTITREVNDLYNLTDEQMSHFKQAVVNSEKVG